MKPLIERITKGPAFIDNADDDMPYLDICVKVGHHAVCKLWQDDAPCHDYNERQHANAEFIAEAFTVAHETGLTPRQMADELSEFRAARKHMDDLFAEIGREGCDEQTVVALARKTVELDQEPLAGLARDIDNMLHPERKHRAPVLPAGLPPLPPGTRYAGQLKDHEGRVNGWIYAPKDSAGWEYGHSAGWFGMKGEPPVESAHNWHVAVPIETPEP